MLVSGKSRQNIISLSFLEFSQSMLKLKQKNEWSDTCTVQGEVKPCCYSGYMVSLFETVVIFFYS